MQHLLKLFGLACLAGFVLLIAVVIYLAYPAIAAVRSEVDALPNRLAQPNGALVDTTHCVHPERLSAWVARKLIAKHEPEPMRSAVWNVRFATWSLAVVPYDYQTIVGLNASLLRRGGEFVGLDKAATSHFRRSFDSLNNAQVLELLLIDAFPAEGRARERTRKACSGHAA